LPIDTVEGVICPFHFYERISFLQIFHDTLLEGWGGGGSDDMRFLLFGYEAALV
jgi:hypothetical protein